MVDTMNTLPKIRIIEKRSKNSRDKRYIHKSSNVHNLTTGTSNRNVRIY
jgi:hypothetical protein